MPLPLSAPKRRRPDPGRRRNRAHRLKLLKRQSEWNKGRRAEARAQGQSKDRAKDRAKGRAIGRAESLAAAS